MSKAKDSLNELLVNVFNYITNIEAILIRKMGVKLSINEVHIIEAIALTKTPTMSNVAKRLLITVGTLTTAINRLVNKGFVTRYQDEKDRRKVYLELTEKGYETKAKHDRFHDEMIEQVIRDMHIDENSELMVALENLQTYFHELYAERMKSL